MLFSHMKLYLQRPSRMFFSALITNGFYFACNEIVLATFSDFVHFP